MYFQMCLKSVLFEKKILVVMFAWATGVVYNIDIDLAGCLWYYVPFNNKLIYLVFLSRLEGFHTSSYNFFYRISIVPLKIIFQNNGDCVWVLISGFICFKMCVPPVLLRNILIFVVSTRSAETNLHKMEWWWYCPDEWILCEEYGRWRQVAWSVINLYSRISMSMAKLCI